MQTFCKKAKWIGLNAVHYGNWKAKVLPAPFLRKVFKIEKRIEKAQALICGLGYYELYLNGRKVGDHVLDPVATQYDRRARYVSYDVSEYLAPGENVVGAVLGNGWYNCHTPEVWHFDKASWRDYPKMLFQLDVDGETAVASDLSWKSATGPIVFDGLRNGETYDARLELGDWLSPDYDDGAWKEVKGLVPPGGILEEQTMPPCKVMETIRPVERHTIFNSEVFDFGQNLSGWCRIRVKGERDTSLRIVYGERLSQPDGSVDQPHSITELILDGRFQTDIYILKGGGEELWEPRFTYHGFRYAQIFINGKAEILDAEARFVYTSFEQIGDFSCSDETLSKIQVCAQRSVKSNFTGIPTDCPQREKNGWTGDAQVSVEAVLSNFDAASSYAHWIDILADAQRPSGQLPFIAPTSGWGFGSCEPTWDAALFFIPWNVYLHTGDSSLIERHYAAMARYLDFCEGMADNGIIRFTGLGDWCPVDWKRICPVPLTSTAHYYAMASLMERFGKLLGRDDDRNRYSVLAAGIKAAFQKEFAKGNGIYGDGGQTAQACALYHDLAEDFERAEALARLLKSIRENGDKLDFGILGAKYVPRVLVENGYARLAVKMIAGKDYPSWGHWIELGATTLWENWAGTTSLNHIMFGDVSAWMLRYLAGIAPDPENPGFKHMLIMPRPESGLAWAKAEHRIAAGRIASSWSVKKDKFSLDVEVPQGSSASIAMPDETVFDAQHGKHHFNCKFILQEKVKCLDK